MPPPREATADRPAGRATLDGIRPDGDDPVAGGPAVAHAGQGQDLPGPAQEALEVEGTAGGEGSGHDGRGDVTAWLFRPDDQPTPFAVEDLPRIADDDANFAWLDLSEYGEAQVREVVRAAQLHPRAGQLMLSPWQRPQLHLYRDPEHVYLSVTVPRLDRETQRVQAGQLDLVFGQNYLVSAHKQPLPFADRVTARAHESPELVQLDAAYMLYLILDELLTYYESLTERVEDEIEAMEERALTDTSDRFLADLLQLKRYVFALGRLAGQHREVFAAFLRPDFPFVSGEEVEPYFRDLEGRLTNLLGSLSAAQEGVNGAFDIYVSHVSHRTNEIMRVLTIVSTVLLPATVILALFSTQFQNTFALLYGRAGFVAMILAILAVTVAILIAFRRRGWL